MQNSHASHSIPLGLWVINKHDENVDFKKEKKMFPVPSKWKNMPLILYNEKKMNPA